MSRGLALTVDRGNTTLDVRAAGRDGLELRRRLEPGASGLAEFVRELGDRGVVVDRVLCCSVVEAALPALRTEAARLGLVFRAAGHELPCPLRLDYPEPATLGVDRWVAAFAASRIVGDAVVIDCGTAVTVDAVTADGHFLGGTIGLGLGGQARALSSAAPVLPEFDGGAPSGWPPNSSLDAVRAGVGLGFVAQVRGLCERLESVWPGASARPRRIVTGGDAELLLSLDASSGFRHEPALVHDGLLLLEAACGSSS